MTRTDTGYTVSLKACQLWIRQNQVSRDDGRDRYMAMERRSKGGWGVWDLQNDHWVMVD